MIIQENIDGHYYVAALLPPLTISREHAFEDPRRGTILKTSTDDKHFQFITPDNDFGVKHKSNMKVLNHIIIIRYEDNEMRMIATAVNNR